MTAEDAPSALGGPHPAPGVAAGPKASKGKLRDKDSVSSKRRCVSTACIACRKRKSKCDGNLPSCAACASVYGTECVYDPNSDHRRKGVSKKDVEGLKTRTTTLQTLVQGILSYSEPEAIDLVRQIRSADNLDDVADAVHLEESASKDELDPPDEKSDVDSEDESRRFEKELSSKMGGLRLETEATRFIGGTSNLIYDDARLAGPDGPVRPAGPQEYIRQEEAVRSWTTVTPDVDLILHLLNMYFAWHYRCFALLSRYSFFKDFFRGNHAGGNRGQEHCSPMLVNAMLALGCHFSGWPEAREKAWDSATVGDHFFSEAKRSLLENDDFENPRLVTVQALALMSAREAGCGRDSTGWVYSGMCFRMASDLGLNHGTEDRNVDDREDDVRRITFWGCFHIDKCWSNYLGRPPQLPLSSITVSKFDIHPAEDSDMWSPWTETGPNQSITQPSRTREVALLNSKLCEISNDILLAFYCVNTERKDTGTPAGLKRLGELHARLELWKKQLAQDLEPREGQLPHMLIVHMFFHILYIHLFRPFLKHQSNIAPLPPNIQPKRVCMQAAAMISKLLRLYKKTYGLRQICNLVVYFAHSACTIHLLNLPDKDARRDISHTFKSLEEMTDSWLCARRSLLILATQVSNWKVDLPADAAGVIERARATFGETFSPRLNSDMKAASQMSPMQVSAAQGANTLENQLGGGRHRFYRKGGLKVRTGSDHQVQGSLAQRYGSQHIISPRIFTSSQSAHVLPSSNGIPGANDSMLINAYQSMKGSKDWWLKEEAVSFEEWTTQDAAAMSQTAGTDRLPDRQWEDVMMSINKPGRSTSQAGQTNANTQGYQDSNTMDGLDYFDFNPGNAYGYQGAST